MNTLWTGYHFTIGHTHTQFECESQIHLLACFKRQAETHTEVGKSMQNSAQTANMRLGSN